MLAAALLLLNASLTFGNVWPTPKIRWEPSVSVELAVCVLLLAVAHHRAERLARRVLPVLWVLLVLSIITVSNRIHYTYLALNQKPMPTGVFARFFFWRDERATMPYDIWVAIILAFVWLVPPDWLQDPAASGLGLLGYLIN